MAHGARGRENHAGSLTCTAPGASYHSSGDFNAISSVAGHGALIQWPYGLSHAKHGPLTEIWYVP